MNQLDAIDDKRPKKTTITTKWNSLIESEGEKKKEYLGMNNNQIERQRACSMHNHVDVCVRFKGNIPFIWDVCFVLARNHLHFVHMHLVDDRRLECAGVLLFGATVFFPFPLFVTPFRFFFLEKSNYVELTCLVFA